MSSPAARNYRERALEEHGEVCHGCEATEDILVHHKDGNRANNDLSNLVPLCETCHGKVHGRSNEFPELVRELGFRPRSPKRSTVQVSESLLDELHEGKSRGESYEDVIWKLVAQKYEEDDE